MAARVPDLPLAPEADPAVLAARARRIAAMLARWEAEDCSDEPEWEVSEIEPLRLGKPPVLSEDPGDKP